MVCISCFIAPLLLFVWYKFIYPVLQPLVSRIWTNYQLPQPFANLTCPIPQKTKPTDTDTASAAANPHTNSGGDHCTRPAVDASAPHEEDSKKFD